VVGLPVGSGRQYSSEEANRPQQHVILVMKGMPLLLLGPWDHLLTCLHSFSTRLIESE
jgi:hypothetical protein